MPTAADQVAARIDSSRRGVHPAEGRVPLSTCVHCGAQCETRLLQAHAWRTAVDGRTTCGGDCWVRFNGGARALGLEPLVAVAAPSPAPAAASPIRRISVPGVAQGIGTMTAYEEQHLEFRCVCGQTLPLTQTRVAGTEAWSPDAGKALADGGWLDGYCGRLCRDRARASHAGGPPLQPALSINDAHYQKARAAAFAAAGQAQPRPLLSSVDAASTPASRGQATPTKGGERR